jgi:hypothetical protein
MHPQDGLDSRARGCHSVQPRAVDALNPHSALALPGLNFLNASRNMKLVLRGPQICVLAGVPIQVLLASKQAVPFASLGSGLLCLRRGRNKLAVAVGALMLLLLEEPLGDERAAGDNDVKVHKPRTISIREGCAGHEKRTC